MPRYTNKLGLPVEFENALNNDDYDKGNSDITVSSLLLPPRIFQLRERHKDEIVTDVVQEIWSLFGKSIHALLAKNARPNALIEERLHVMCNGWKVSGQFDIYEGGIDDYKVTSGWTVVFKSRLAEWGWQLNFYRLLAEAWTFPVARLRNILIIRDWSQYDSWRNPDFPKQPAVIVPQMMHPIGLVRETLKTRVVYHQNCSKLGDDELPICSPEERWAKPTKFAVKKETAKQAIKVFDKKEDAQIWLETNQPKYKQKLYLEFRPGESVRCKSYCEVNTFCNFYNDVIMKEQPKNEMEEKKNEENMDN